ncbi:UNVERIFIED_CONTAM: Peptide deformylase 1A, chloroplastic [Sesamum calycinum]|uniref:Peptide deformylase n=1 Tax=Sesamum calycinum TaxID=2727403 RepID=A0AAW2NER6_9LAMI
MKARFEHEIAEKGNIRVLGYPINESLEMCKKVCVDGFRAVVERNLEVEVTGFDRNGQAIKVDASGWQARIFQHECDHLDGTLYVDKMVPRTFRTVDNLDLPLALGCPKLGVRQS